jgi:hypothetical protein
MGELREWNVFGDLQKFKEISVVESGVSCATIF